MCTLFFVFLGHQFINEFNASPKQSLTCKATTLYAGEYDDRSGSSKRHKNTKGRRRLHGIWGFI